MACRFNIVICDGKSVINKAYTEITLSKEYSNIDDSELDTVLPHILSTHRLPNNDILTMTAEKKVVFRPYPYPTLILSIREKKLRPTNCSGKDFMNVVSLIVKDVFLRYGNKNSPELLIHAYGKYETGLSGYSKIVE